MCGVRILFRRYWIRRKGNTMNNKEFKELKRSFTIDLRVLMQTFRFNTVITTVI